MEALVAKARAILTFAHSKQGLEFDQMEFDALLDELKSLGSFPASYFPESFTFHGRDRVLEKMEMMHADGQL
jgi:hypothetical protein